MCQDDGVFWWPGFYRGVGVKGVGSDFLTDSTWILHTLRCFARFARCPVITASPGIRWIALHDLAHQ